MLNGLIRAKNNRLLRLRLWVQSWWFLPQYTPDDIHGHPVVLGLRVELQQLAAAYDAMTSVVRQQCEQMTIRDIHVASLRNTIGNYEASDKLGVIHPAHDHPRAHGAYLVFLGGGRRWYEANYSVTGWRVLSPRDGRPITHWRRLPVGPVDRGLPYQARNGVAS